MGNTGGVSPADDVVPFVEGCQQEGVEVNGPDAIVRLFQADVLVHHGVGEIAIGRVGAWTPEHGPAPRQSMRAPESK